MDSKIFHNITSVEVAWISWYCMTSVYIGTSLLFHCMDNSTMFTKYKMIRYNDVYEDRDHMPHVSPTTKYKFKTEDRGSYVFKKQQGLDTIDEEIKGLKRTRLPCIGDILWSGICNLVCVMFPTMMYLAVQDAGYTFTGWCCDSMLDRIKIAIWMMMGHELLFYTCHRYILHSKTGYKLFGHAMHHQSDAGCGATALYMTFPDFALEIVVPYVLPLIMCPFNIGLIEHVVIVILGMVGGVYEHSGYNFFKHYGIDTSFHWLHHGIKGVNFGNGVGTLGILDAVLDTSL